MRFVLRWISVVGVAIMLGAVSALALSGLLPGLAGLANGKVVIAGWAADFDVGSTAADPYTRARIARHGLLALARSEAVYFVRNADDEGDRLREECRYRLSGASMPAQWWSVTLYDAASRLPMNDDDAWSIDASRAGEGEWNAIVAPQRLGEGLWLSSRNGGDFDLTLRLYIPAGALIDDPESVLLPPRVERLGCAGGAS